MIGSSNHLPPSAHQVVNADWLFSLWQLQLARPMVHVHMPVARILLLALHTTSITSTIGLAASGGSARPFLGWSIVST